MADTLNFAWTKPTPDGSSGTWDTILNTLFDDIDADVKLISTAADLAKAELLSYPPIPAEMGFYAELTTDIGAFIRVSAHNLILDAPSKGSNVGVFVPLPGLRNGQIITGYKSRGAVDSGITCTISLRRVKDGTATIIHAGHTLPSVAATTTTSGLSHTVDATYSYYIRAEASGVTPSNVAALAWVQPVVSR